LQPQYSESHVFTLEGGGSAGMKFVKNLNISNSQIHKNNSKLFFFNFLINVQLAWTNQFLAYLTLISINFIVKFWCWHFMGACKYGNLVLHFKPLTSMKCCWILHQDALAKYYWITGFLSYNNTITTRNKYYNKTLSTLFRILFY